MSELSRDDHVPSKHHEVTLALPRASGRRRVAPAWTERSAAPRWLRDREGAASAESLLQGRSRSRNSPCDQRRDPEHVLARATSPRLAMDRAPAPACARCATRRRARAAARLEGRDGRAARRRRRPGRRGGGRAGSRSREQRAREAARCSSGAGLPEVDRADPGGHESAVHPGSHSSGSSAAGARWASSRRRRSIHRSWSSSVHRRPCAASFSAARRTVCSASRISGALTMLLQDVAPRPQPVLRSRSAAATRMRRPGALQRARLVRRSQRRFDALQLVLELASLAELPL